MGNITSNTKENHIFQQELMQISLLINGIINDKDVYRNNDYNFLSHDSCDKYQILLENELEKHLKLEVNEIGQKLYVIPKNHDDLPGHKQLSKKDVCKKIANHYMKILYIISLIKYVYNVEQDGDYSIAGIIFRNIKIIDDLMEIKYCDMPHKDPKNPGLKDTEIDFSGLEGMKFFTDYFLDGPERNNFIDIIKIILGRKKNNHKLCSYFSDNKELLKKFNCNKYEKKLSNKEGRKNNLLINISENNAVFSNNMCWSIKKIIIKTHTNPGKQVFNSYIKMKDNYMKNVSSIHKILNRLIYKKKDNYSLYHLTSNDLDTIIKDIKKIVQSFYIQSILDFQILLDGAKKIPNLNENITQ